MSEPLLTIGIPTLDRADFLHRALRSCLAQTVPVKVIVADQGETEATANTLKEYQHQPHVRHIRTGAKSLWQNWVAAAKACDTPYFAWLQDDDALSPGMARRVTMTFGMLPEAHTWCARLQCSNDGIHVFWPSGNGPLCGMRFDGGPTLLDGAIFTPIAYCTSMALSPAVAFRCGPDFDEALDACPDNCDLWLERLILAAMGLKHPIACDPSVAGMWIHHGRNESYRQRANQEEQLKRVIPWIDDMMDRLSEWRYPFTQWLSILPLPHLAGCGGPVFAESFEQSRYCREMRELFTAAANACNQPQSGMPAEFGPVVVNTDILQPNRPMPKMPPVVEAFRYEEDMAEVAG